MTEEMIKKIIYEEVLEAECRLLKKLKEALDIPSCCKGCHWVIPSKEIQYFPYYPCDNFYNITWSTCPGISSGTYNENI